MELALSLALDAVPPGGTDWVSFLYRLDQGLGMGRGESHQTGVVLSVSKHSTIGLVLAYVRSDLAQALVDQRRRIALWYYVTGEQHSNLATVQPAGSTRVATLSDVSRGNWEARAVASYATDSVPMYFGLRLFADAQQGNCMSVHGDGPWVVVSSGHVPVPSAQYYSLECSLAVVYPPRRSRRKSQRRRQPPQRLTL